MTENYKHILLEYLDNSAVATFIVTPDHRVIFWNKACEKLTGVGAEEILATSNHWKPFYKEQRPCLADIVIEGNYKYLPELYEKYEKSKLSERGITAEAWFPDLGGKNRYVVFDAVPVFNDAGELVAAIETLNDITDLKNNENEKERVIRNLKSIVAEYESLKGYIPICSSCKSIRNRTGAWQSPEDYFRGKGDMEFTHSLCPKCSRKLYPGIFEK